jgi:hypothetical protein
MLRDESTKTIVNLPQSNQEIAAIAKIKLPPRKLASIMLKKYEEESNSSQNSVVDAYSRMVIGRITDERKSKPSIETARMTKATSLPK